MSKNVESACLPRARSLSHRSKLRSGTFQSEWNPYLPRSSRNSERESKASDNSLRM
jgi:hypothetical protein